VHPDTGRGSATSGARAIGIFAEDADLALRLRHDGSASALVRTGRAADASPFAAQRTDA
jgi:hypothetical protein